MTPTISTQHAMLSQAVTPRLTGEVVTASRSVVYEVLCPCNNTDRQCEDCRAEYDLALVRRQTMDRLAAIARARLAEGTP